MLKTGFNCFGWRLDNFGATLTTSGIAAAVTAAGSAHTKGSAVSLIAGASVTEDVYGIMVGFCRVQTSTAAHKFMTDLLIDTAGGTSWSVLINNLLCCQPEYQFGGHRFYFPLFIPAGTSIGAQTQCSTANLGVRCFIELFGKPSSPEHCWTGTTVDTIGADTATTTGVAVTPGNGAVGSWTSIGTLSNDAQYYQAGYIINDTSMATSVRGTCIDLSVGSASSKRIAIQQMHHEANTSEFTGKTPLGINGMPYMTGVAGETVYVRSMCVTTPDSSHSVVVYAVR